MFRRNPLSGCTFLVFSAFLFVATISGRNVWVEFYFLFLFSRSNEGGELLEENISSSNSKSFFAWIWARYPTQCAGRNNIASHWNRYLKNAESEKRFRTRIEIENRMKTTTCGVRPFTSLARSHLGSGTCHRVLIVVHPCSGRLLGYLSSQGLTRWLSSKKVAH